MDHIGCDTGLQAIFCCPCWLPSAGEEIQARQPVRSTVGQLSSPGQAHASARATMSDTRASIWIERHAVCLVQGLAGGPSCQVRITFEASSDLLPGEGGVVRFVDVPVSDLDPAGWRLFWNSSTSSKLTRYTRLISSKGFLTARRRSSTATRDASELVDLSPRTLSASDLHTFTDPVHRCLYSSDPALAIPESGPRSQEHGGSGFV